KELIIKGTSSGCYQKSHDLYIDAMFYTKQWNKIPKKKLKSTDQEAVYKAIGKTKKPFSLYSLAWNIEILENVYPIFSKNLIREEFQAKYLELLEGSIEFFYFEHNNISVSESLLSMLDKLKMPKNIVFRFFEVGLEGYKLACRDKSNEFKETKIRIFS